jgi:hypothetical protein
MSAQKQFQPRSPEPEGRRPFERTQEFLKGLSDSMTLLKKLFPGLKLERLELYFYRTIIVSVTIIHLIQFLWYSIWH